MTRKLTTVEFIRRASEVHQNRYAYPSTEYKGGKALVAILCPEHGAFRQVAEVHLQRHGCPYCADLSSAKNRKWNPSKLLASLQSKHPLLQFPNFHESLVTVTDKVPVVCPTHGSFSAAPHHLLRGKGCRLCGLERTAASRRVTEDDFISKAKAIHGGAYTYTHLEYSGYSNPVTITCPTHGDFTMLPDTHINQGSGCFRCGVERRSSDRIVPFSDFLDRATITHGNTYTYAESSYTKISDPITITCSKHGSFDQLPFDHLNGSNCPKCAGIGSSKPQEAMANFLREYGVDLIENYRYGVGKKEVDIYIPSCSLAVEFNGVYFHSSKFKAPGAHLAKARELQNLGIRLIQIFEDEWSFRNTQVRYLLLTASGAMPTTAYARSCTVVPIGQEDASEFYTDNHIQGPVQGGTHVGLSHQGNLIAVMTFGKRHSHRGFSSKEGLELTRFASFGRVAGAASRLFSHLLQITEATSVVSYSDNRLFSGGMYSVLGFKKVHTTDPSYTYVLPGVLRPRMHKSLFRHSHLPKLFGSRYDPSKSERENCEANNYWRIYDCGLTKWRYSL